MRLRMLLEPHPSQLFSLRESQPSVNRARAMRLIRLGFCYPADSTQLQNVNRSCSSKRRLVADSDTLVPVVVDCPAA